MAELPTGSEATSFMTPTDTALKAPPGIPDDQNPTPVPPLPGSVPGPAGKVPEFWADAGRIVADILELYSTEPELAQEIWKFVKAKLNKI